MYVKNHKSHLTASQQTAAKRNQRGNLLTQKTYFFTLSPKDATSSRAFWTLINTSWMAYSLSIKPLGSESWQGQEKHHEYVGIIGMTVQMVIVK